jgi:hypothetical protein
MSNLQVRVNNQPLVFGGNVNSTLKTWMEQLGIRDFAHAKMLTRSIVPAEIKLSADFIRREYGHYTYIFTVGIFADKVLTAAGIDHGAFPATSTTDKKSIVNSMANCRTYLMRRMYHAPTSSNPECS